MIRLEMEISEVGSVKAQASVFSVINGEWRRIAAYLYKDETGEPLFRVVRRERGDGSARQKAFHQERYERGCWIKGLGDVRRVPYHLNEIVQRNSVLIVEGEKDCDTIRRRFRLAATTSPMGAGKWLPQYNQYLAQKDVTIISDNDQKGRAHVLTVAEQLLPVAALVRVLELPELSEKGDVTDWVNAGGTREQLLALRRKAQIIDGARLDQLRRRWDTAMSDPAQRSEFRPVSLGELLLKPKVPRDWIWKWRLVAGTVSSIAASV